VSDTRIRLLERRERDGGDPNDTRTLIRERERLGHGNPYAELAGLFASLIPITVRVGRPATVALFRESDGVEILNTNTDEAHMARTFVRLAADTSVIVRVRAPELLPFESVVLLTSMGLDMTTVNLEDPFYLTDGQWSLV
jgi:hypothetical protein